MATTQIALLLAAAALLVSLAVALLARREARGLRARLERLLTASTRIGAATDPEPGRVPPATAAPASGSALVAESDRAGVADDVLTPMPIGADDADESAEGVRRTLALPGSMIRLAAVAYGLRQALSAEGRWRVCEAYRRELRRQRRSQRAAAWASASRQIKDAWRRQ